MCEGKMAACFRADQPNTIFIDKTLPKEIKSLTLGGYCQIIFNFLNTTH